MFKASLIDEGSHFPIGGELVTIPVLPRVGEQITVDGVRFRVESIAHRLETGPMGSYKALIYLWALDRD